jgi:O-succinylbenzoic acid--CoA ligase
MVVEGWLARAAAARPERTALETPGRSCSYAELLELASAGAGELAARGAGRGTRVAIELPPGLAFAQALHACLLLGAVALPVDVRASEAERRRTAAGVAVHLTEPLAERTRGPSVRSAAHELDATAVILQTSGTTAEPRPVELSYGNFLWSALGSSVALGHDPGERWLCTLPLCHVGGLSILLRSCVHATTAIVHERFETDRVLRSLREEGVTLVSLVATTLARVLDADLAQPPSLRCALTGGGPVPAGLLDRARRRGVPVSLTYGLSEACSQVTTTPVAAIASDGPLAAGPPLFCTRLQIAPDGEILVRGPTVSPSAPSVDGWLHTGDLGSVGADGALRVLGRKAETIVSGGENVSPSEVEAVLEAHPQVLEAAVLGSPDEHWGEAVTALVVAREGAELDEQQLRSHCAGALAPFKVPKRILAVSGPLPRTRSGKLLRRELR